jgi:streptomycin 6-kinase
MPGKGSVPEIPQKLRSIAAARGQTSWLQGLGDEISALELRWGLIVGPAAKHSTEAFVAEATTAEGEPATLKIVMPGIDPTRHELRILNAARGRGYARLLRADATVNVLLIERLGLPLAESSRSADDQIEVICRTLPTAWSAVPKGPALPNAAEKAAELAETIQRLWAAAGRPCGERTLEEALACAERRARAFDPDRAVVAHGDPHWWNTLAAPDSPTGFKFIDPDGILAEPAFDLAVLMREWGDTVPTGDLVALGARRCALLVSLTGAEPAAIWDWAMLHCLSSGLDWFAAGEFAAAAPQLAMPEAWAPSGLIARG